MRKAMADENRLNCKLTTLDKAIRVQLHAARLFRESQCNCSHQRPSRACLTLSDPHSKRIAGGCARRTSPNQVLTHAARAAAKQLNFFQPPLVAARAARAKGSG